MNAPILSEFLSIQAQDFIEEHQKTNISNVAIKFLSIQAQDFIEESRAASTIRCWAIPEHSSSGLH